jgi:GNAT superfamily N-acetyltransferase
MFVTARQHDITSRRPSVDQDATMTHDSGNLPPDLTFGVDPDSSGALRRALGAAINAHHASTVPHSTERFVLHVHDQDGDLAAGLSASLAWGWLFIEALFVADAYRGRGIGRALMIRAEDQARAKGCHAAWLDTFQARGFYAALGYESFATLQDYPPGQSRHFMRKRLVP